MIKITLKPHITLDTVESLIALLGHKRCTKVISKNPIVLEKRDTDVSILYKKDLVAYVTYQNDQHKHFLERYKLPNTIIGDTETEVKTVFEAYLDLVKSEDRNMLSVFKKTPYISASELLKLLS